MSNIKRANLNLTLKNLFFKWMEITRSFHKLPPLSQKVLALFLYNHYLLRKETTNEKILWKLVFDYDTKLKIREELEISDNTLQNILTSFRKAKIIVDNTITNVYIPDLELDSKNFQVIFNFNIVDNAD